MEVVLIIASAALPPQSGWQEALVSPLSQIPFPHKAEDLEAGVSLELTPFFSPDPQAERRSVTMIQMNQTRFMGAIAEHCSISSSQESVVSDQWTVGVIRRESLVSVKCQVFQCLLFRCQLFR